MRPNGPGYRCTVTILPPPGKSSPACAAAIPPRWTLTEIARAVIESVAENTSDAVVAPLLWGAVAGIPGLVAYRAVNTLDAMVGHRSARYLRFGWASARLDDVANWIPARVTAALTAACAPLVTRTSPVKVLQCRAPRRRPPSEPERGPVRGRLRGGPRCPPRRDERLRRRGRGAPRAWGAGRAPEPEDIRRAILLSRAVTVAATALAVLIAGLTGGG